MSSVKTMDSSGPGTPASCRQSPGQDGRVMLSSVQPEVTTPPKLAHLDRGFPVLSSPQSPLAEYRP